MTTKGKVFQFVGLRFQMDPLILARRIITRQIPLLVVIAITGGILTIVGYKHMPRTEEAPFEFKNRHPEISSALTILDGVDSPVSALDAPLRQAKKKGLAAIKAGQIVAMTQSTGKATPSSDKLRGTRQALKSARQSYTENHPRVLAIQRQVTILQAEVLAERVLLTRIKQSRHPEDIRFRSNFHGKSQA